MDVCPEERCEIYKGSKKGHLRTLASKTGIALADMVRVPQYRNCVMISCKAHPAMRTTLDAIVAKVCSLSHSLNC